jgi:hypothetical protein
MLDLTRLEADLDRLFRAPLADFVAKRNALAARARKEGAREAADRVKELAKPSVSAWVVNQLWWKAKKPFERLLDAGAALRDAQRAGAGASADALGRAARARRAALAELLGRSESLLIGAGQATSRGMLRRIETTLEAIATHGDAGPEQTLGRMHRDLEAPGFDALLSLAAVPARSERRAKGAGTASEPGRPRLVKPARDEARKRAEASLRAAEAEAARRRAEADKAESERAAAATRARQARHEAELSKRRYEQTRQRSEKLRAEARNLETRARRAMAAREKAERAVEKARSTLEGARKGSR